MAVVTLDIMPVASPGEDTVNQMPVLRPRVHPDVLFGREKTVLVMSRSCMAQVFNRSRPLLLHFPTLWYPITLPQATWSLATWVLKSPKYKKLVWLRHSWAQGVKLFIEFVFGFLWIGHGRTINTEQHNSAFIPHRGLQSHQVIVEPLWEATAF